jgi:hemerythrin-like domain-containing protein
MKITEALLAEHQVFHHLFDHIERCAPKLQTVAQVRSLAALLETMLAAHSRTEDELFVHPLEHCLEQIGQNDPFHHEHDEIDRMLSLAQKAVRLNTARTLLLSAVLASRKHFDKEERIVFPLAERVLKTNTLTALGKDWMERRRKAVVIS